MVTGSTMPFIWDDPSTPNEVSQLAIDLGNSAVRGKISQDTQLPRTGCLVTANFDMSEMLKYFSRIVVLLVEGSGKTKVAGEAMLLEEEAKKASASFPLVMKQLNSLQIENIHHEYRLLREQLPTDIRILEGIAVNLHVTRQILNLAGRYHYLPYVQNYIRQTMVPYYKKQLVDVPMVTPVTTVEFDLSDAINIAMLNPQNAMIMKGGTILALDPRALCKDISHAAGVTYNKATKFQGKTKKMIQIRTDVLDEDCLKTISERTRKQTLTAADTKTQETNQQQPPLPLPEHQPPSPEPMQPQTREVLQQPTPEVLQQPTPEAPQSPTPEAPQSPTPEAPQSQTPEAPQSQTPEAPRSPTPEAPQSPTPEAPQSPTPEAPQSPTPEAPQSPTPEAPQSPTLEAPQSPTPDAPQSPTPEAQQQPTPKQLPSVQNRRRKRIWLPTPIQSSAPEDPITCNKCNKIGREGRLWVQCEKCDRWYHSSCQGIASKRHRSVEFQKTPWMCC